METKSLCLDTVGIVRNASSIIKAAYNKVSAADIKLKDRNDLVSYVDIETESFLIKELSSLLPDAAFLAEESGETSGDRGSDYLWIIDPLDGTTNFLHNIPVFSISVALQHKGKIILGVVLEVNRDECFYAYEGGGAFMNAMPVKVSKTHELANSLLATGFPFREFEVIEKFNSIFTELMRKTRGLRRLGSAAVDLAYVACGRFDAFFEFNLNAWDVAAGTLIVREAGGLVTDFKGGDDCLFGKQILASNPYVHGAMLEIVERNTC